MGLNHRPTVYETVALPLSYAGPEGRGWYDFERPEIIDLLAILFPTLYCVNLPVKVFLFLTMVLISLSRKTLFTKFNIQSLSCAKNHRFGAFNVTRITFGRTDPLVCLTGWRWE